jgi:choline dehydrogenase-like flavoprotein
MPIRRAGDAELAPIDRAFLAAAQAQGFPHDRDMNAPESLGVGLLPVNNADGVRFNTALAYLDPAGERPNLTVQGDAEVRRILFDGCRATGVEVTVDGREERLLAGEVVLSAGAVKSPQLLMTSGIGPAEELRRHGITLRRELPQVGRAFTDHCSFTLPFRMPRRSSPLPDPLESTWAHAALHFTSQASDAVSDLLIMQSAIPTTYLVFYGQSLLARLKMLKAMQGAISLGKLIDHARYGFDHALTCVMLRDDSRGEIRLTSADPADRPELIYHYLETDRDRARARELMRTAAALIASEPYRRLGARRAVLSDAELADDAALDAHNRKHQGTSIHMASSCRMSPSAESGVVDQYCRVHDVERLRVVDTSIMPRVVRRCPAATAVMLGERAAAFFN